MQKEAVFNNLQISDLEVQIDYLIHIVQKLKTENLHLKEKLAVSIRENTLLKEQNLSAAAKVKQILSQLKEEHS